QMYKRLIVITLALFSICSIQAQPPKTAQIVYQQGVDFMMKENYQKAMISFFKAVSLYKQYDSALFQMGNINAHFQSFDTAINFYKKALAANPRYVEALINLGGLYKNTQHDINSALGCYLKVIAIDSTNKDALVWVAWCYNNLKHYDKAIPYAIKALDLDNNLKGAYGELGFAYKMSKRYAEAVEQFKKNIARSPNEIPMFYAGLCYIELKDKDGATSMYNELVKISSKLADGLKKKIDAM
ncbi:MAG TPA: tetratricopeptide repeat protein, partial [Ferruginibacter sp.]|nr:tetratricopeptide repeat protein [Ferruginibacter sp.]